MPKVLNFYMDDSGTREPNRKSWERQPNPREFFALGGVLINEEDEAEARRLYDRFCSKWSISYPLHSSEIRGSTGNFTWLLRQTDDYDRFMVDITKMLTAMPVLGLACVIDRYGYDTLYRERYGRRQWHLCQTAFCIAVERAAKFARRDGRKLRVMPERSGKDDERRLKQYYNDLRTQGPPFEASNSNVYAPLSASDFHSTLYELRFKRKSSPMMQIADLFLWPMVKAGHDTNYLPFVKFKQAGRLIECRLQPWELASCGTKYSCFGVAATNSQVPKTTKAQTSV
jgi:uncharacterized protein DUF3800